MLIVKGGQWQHAIREIGHDMEATTFCMLVIKGNGNMYLENGYVTCGDCLANMKRESVRWT